MSYIIKYSFNRCRNFVQEKGSATSQLVLLLVALLHRRLDLHDDGLPRHLHPHVLHGQVKAGLFESEFKVQCSYKSELWRQETNDKIIKYRVTLK